MAEMSEMAEMSAIAGMAEWPNGKEMAEVKEMFISSLPPIPHFAIASIRLGPLPGRRRS
jgi:hypothetical protein